MIPATLIHKYNNTQTNYKFNGQEFNNYHNLLFIYLKNDINFDLQIGLYEFLFNPKFKFFKTIFGDGGIWQCCGSSIENECECNDYEHIADPVPAYEFHMSRCAIDESALGYLERLK